MGKIPDYSVFISKTIEVIKKNKWLFVYGFVLAIFSSGSSTSNFRLPNGDNLPNLKDSIPSDLPEETSQVLGAYTSQLLDWVGSVSLYTWVVLVLGIIFLVLFGVTIRVILTAWATGGLIGGLDLAFRGNLVTLKNSVNHALANIKGLVVFGFISLLIFLGLSLALVSFWGIIYFLIQNVEALKSFWVIVGSVVGIVAFFLMFVFYLMIEAYAQRLIVLKGYKPWLAWKKALSLSRSSFLPTLVMGIINSLLTGVVGCLSIILIILILGIPTFVLILPYIKKGQIPPVSVILSLLATFLLFVNLNILVQAAMIIFKHGNWNQMFYHVWEKIEGGKNE